MVVNSSYGKCGLNKEKQRDYSYYAKDTIYKKSKCGDGPIPVREMKKSGQKIKEDPFTVSMNEVIGEYNSDHMEFIKRKKSYTETTPIHFSHFILSHAKLHMLMFIDMIIDYWQTEHVTICYTGSVNYC